MIVIALTVVQFRFIERGSSTDGREQAVAHVLLARDPDRRHLPHRFPALRHLRRLDAQLDEIVRADAARARRPLLENYKQGPEGRPRGPAPVAQMMANSLVMALVIAFGKIAISIVAFAIVYFRFPLRISSSG